MKERITITLDKGLIDQIDKRVDGNINKNRSQQIEVLLTKALGTYKPEKAIILAGGEIIQSESKINTIPSCMLIVNGKTIMEHLFDLFKKFGIRDVIISVGYMKEKIKDIFEDGSNFGVNITYIEEEKGLGTGGALKLMKELIHDSFIVANGDELKSINIPRMFRLHKRKDALATIALTTAVNIRNYGVARMSGSRVIEYIEKPDSEEPPSNLINAGFYILEPEVINLIPDGYSMLEKDIFPKLAKQGKMRGFITSGQWFDISIPERFETAKTKWLGVNPYEDID
jgi:NDP-sugar pyrophosphorylase family protein